MKKHREFKEKQKVNHKILMSQMTVIKDHLE